MRDVLVVGYGNPSRRDDGVGLAVVNGLRNAWGRPPLDELEGGFAELGQPVDTLFLHQLNPELAELLAEFAHVIFVDAHLGVYEALVRRVTLDAQPGFALVSHHFKPGTLLAFARQAYGHAPTAELISIRGFDFDFGEGLSARSAAGVDEVVAELAARYADKSGLQTAA